VASEVCLRVTTPQTLAVARVSSSCVCPPGGAHRWGARTGAARSPCNVGLVGCEWPEMPDGDGDRSLVGDAAEGTARVGIAVSWSCCWVELVRSTGHDGGEQGSVAGAVPARCVACQGSQRQLTSTMRHCCVCSLSRALRPRLQLQVTKTAGKTAVTVGGRAGKVVAEEAKDGLMTGARAGSKAAKAKAKNIKISNPMFGGGDTDDLASDLVLAPDDDDDYDDYDDAEGAPPATKAELQIDELSDLRSTFEACDSDKSGGMDLSELITVLRLWEVDRDAGQLGKELMDAAKQGCADQPAGKAQKFQLLLETVGLPWDMLEPPMVANDELNFSEFMYMLNSGVRRSSCRLNHALSCFLLKWPSRLCRCWKTSSQIGKREPSTCGCSAADVRQLELFFLHRSSVPLPSGSHPVAESHCSLATCVSDDTADIDGDGELTKEELHLAIGSLQAGQLTDDEFDQIWGVLNAGGKPFLTFTEFLEGMVTIKTQPELGLRDKFNLTKPNQLMSLVLDTPVAAWEHDQILSDFDALEKVGITVLKRHNEEMSTAQKVRLMERAHAGTIHELHDGQRDRLTALHNKNIWQAFAIGFISCVSGKGLTNCLACLFHISNEHRSDLGIRLPCADHHFHSGKHCHLLAGHRRRDRFGQRHAGSLSEARPRRSARPREVSDVLDHQSLCINHLYHRGDRGPVLFRHEKLRQGGEQT
jgi:Ca2+-binding EF-hand superfamily protein